MRSIRLMAPLAALAILATACGGDGTITIDGQQANDHGSEEVVGESSVEFELDDFYFGPTVLRGGAGQTLTLEAFNEGESPHTFTIEGVVDQEVQPDDTVEIEVTFPDSGTLLFICRFHASQGMRGGLEVES